MIYEARPGEHKIGFFARVYNNDCDNTYVFNDVSVTIKKDEPLYLLAARIHDAFYQIHCLEQQYRR